MSGSSGFPGLYSGGQQLNMGSLQNIPRLIVTLLVDCKKTDFPQIFRGKFAEEIFNFD